MATPLMIAKLVNENRRMRWNGSAISVNGVFALSARLHAENDLIAPPGVRAWLTRAHEPGGKYSPLSGKHCKPRNALEHRSPWQGGL